MSFLKDFGNFWKQKKVLAVEVKIEKFKFFFLIICIIQLFYIFYFRSGFKYEVIKSPFNENSGIFYALHPSVIESNDFLIKHKAIDFNLSKNLIPKDWDQIYQRPDENTYFYQRSIEFNYPIRINNISKLIFFSLEENIPSNCREISNGKYLKLIKCWYDKY